MAISDCEPDVSALEDLLVEKAKTVMVSASGSSSCSFPTRGAAISMGFLRRVLLSFMAVLRNKGAFVVYALSWFGVAFAASFVVRVLNAMLGDNPVAMSMVLSPLSLILISAVYCSFWPTYRDAVADAQTRSAGQGA